MTLPNGEILRGSATTALNGQFYVASARTNCSGTYEGRSIGGVALSVGRKAVVTAQCSNGKTGTSQDALYETGAAQLTFSDGSKATLSISPNP